MILLRALRRWRARRRRRQCQHPTTALLQTLVGSDFETVECLACGDWLLRSSPPSSTVTKGQLGAHSDRATAPGADGQNG